MQSTREVEGLVFKMTSDLGKVKRKIDMLGTAKDTVRHRSGGVSTQQIASADFKAAQLISTQDSFWPNHLPARSHHSSRARSIAILVTASESVVMTQQ